MSASLDFTCPLFVSMEAYYIHNHETMDGKTLRKSMESNALLLPDHYLKCVALFLLAVDYNRKADMKNMNKGE